MGSTMPSKQCKAAGKKDSMEMKKGPWSPEEDQKLVAYIQRYGIWNWNHMADPAGLARTGKSCRLRWMNYLRPNIKHGNFSKEEEETIIKWHQLLGNKWATIAGKLPGRTDSEIKNYWNTRLKKHGISEKPVPAPSTDQSAGSQHASVSPPGANLIHDSDNPSAIKNSPQETNSTDSGMTTLQESGFEETKIDNCMQVDWTDIEARDLELVYREKIILSPTMEDAYFESIYRLDMLEIYSLPEYSTDDMMYDDNLWEN
ncbi:hypothetical protein SAY87_012712 [Trapa incisa]|uniref:Uncharacterized protein n=1 Tax=Trapa incisa TaxID=236973 RepID=A0AAN7GQX8_9MYRT|nr:hypothetical protein SAY87_012712 [Trapa incisa]